MIDDLIARTKRAIEEARKNKSKSVSKKKPNGSVSSEKK